MPAHVAPVVVSRIKVMARLDIAERRVPQDGRIGLTLGGKLLDVRVSTLPSRAGERVVLRILDKENAGIDLDSLGMPAGCPRAVPRRADRAERHRPRHRPDRIGQDHQPLCRPAAPQRRQPQHPHRRGSGRICGRRSRPDPGQPEGRPELRRRPSSDPSPGSGRRHGRRDTRPRNRRDRRPGLADRPPRPLHRPHQRRDRSDHPDARHEGRALPARLDLARGDRPAAGQAALPGLPGAGRGRCVDRGPGRLRARQRSSTSRAAARECGNSGYKGRIGVFEAVRIDDNDPPADQQRRRRGRDLRPCLPQQPQPRRGGARSSSARA